MARLRSVVLLCLATLASGCAAASPSPSAPAPAAEAETRAIVADGPSIRRRKLPDPVTLTFRDGQHALVKPYAYPFPGTPDTIHVPAGFVTDFASIPGLLRVVFSEKVDRVPALIHDYLYWRQECEKDEADRLFGQMLDEAGASWLGEKLRYLGVRNPIADEAWRQNRNDRIAGLPRFVPLVELHRVPEVAWKRYRVRLRDAGTPLDKTTPPAPYCRRIMDA